MKKLINLLFFTIFTVILSVSIHAAEYYTPELHTSSDSVSDKILLDLDYDELTNTTYLKVSVDKMGIEIYDTKDTDYVDGIRLNGETVNSTKFPVDTTKPINVTVRTVYKNDFTGTLAQIYDGTYDYTNLLSNPIVLLTGGYYILAIISLITSTVVMVRSKSKKNIVPEKYETTAEAILNSQELIIEAIALMNSKDPNSHLEALECLKKASTNSSNYIINAVAGEVKESTANLQAHKTRAIETLKTIAETAQEESANVTPPIL